MSGPTTAHKLTGQRTGRLPDPKTPSPPGSHHQGPIQRRRRRLRPLLRVRNRARRRAEPGATLDRDRHLAQGSGAGEHPAPAVHGNPVPRPVGYCKDGHPRRTDIEAPIPYRQNKHVLFGQQEGRCIGCKSAFEFRHLEVDHIIPRDSGNQDNVQNLQLLCAHCNRVKGNRSQEYLMARLVEMGITA